MGYACTYGVGTPRQSDFDVLRAYEGTHWLADPDGGRIHVTEQNARDAVTFLQARPHGRSPGPQPRRGANSSLGLHAQQAAEQVGIRLTNESAGVSGSDHAPLLLAGIPVLWIGAALSDDWMSTRYHSPKDDMSQPLDFGAASDHSRRVFAVTFLTAQAPERPTWNRGEFFQTFRR